MTISDGINFAFGVWAVYLCFLFTRFLMQEILKKLLDKFDPGWRMKNLAAKLYGWE